MLLQSVAPHLPPAGWLAGWQRLFTQPKLASPPAPSTPPWAQTLVNFTHDGCLVTVPLLLAGGVAMALYAARLWWQRTGMTVRLAAPGAPS